MSFPFPNQSNNSISPVIAYKEPYSHKTYDCMINNIQAIQYTVEDSLQLNRILTSCKDNFLVPQIRVTWPHLNEAFASNLSKLLISLKAYYDSSNPVIRKEDLIDILCQKEAASVLKNLRIKAMMKAWDSTFVEEPSWWNETKTYTIYDIGDIFYYKYCFFWEEECEDYKFQSQPLKYKKRIVKEFVENTELVMDELDFDFDFEPSEILYQPRSSKVLDANFKSQTDFQVRYSKNPEFRFGKRNPGKRIVIPVHPGGVRDGIINQIPDLNTIMAIDKLVGKCLRKHPFTVLNNVERFSKILDDFHFRFPFFYCRDIEKEGITKPRYLMKIMLTALMKRCPYFSQVCTSDFFDGDWCQLEDGTVIHSDRGHGLGMGNSLTTLMQIIIYRMTFNRYAEDHDIGEKSVDFFTLNDDCVFGLDLPEDEVFEFSQLDHEVLEELGLIRKKTKSFIVKGGFVFLEIYFPFAYSRKDSINRRTMLLPYAASNIVHAKDLMSLMTDNPYMDEILSKWGYEFYPDEVNQPRHFGGWFSKNFYGLDISLDIPMDSFSSQQSRAAQAVLESDKKFKRKLVSHSDPFNLLPYKDIDDYIYNKLPIVGSTMFSSYERLKIRSDFNIIYDRLYKKRQRIFSKSKYVDFKTYLTELRESSDRDIFIASECKSWIYNFDITRYENGTFTDPYRYNYPISSAIRKIKDVWIKGKPTSFWPLTQSDSSFSCSILRSEIAEMNLDYYAFEYTDEDVVLPTDENEFKEFILSWRNPISVAKYCQIRFNRLMIPLKVPSFIKYKQNFFKRDLTREEFIILEGRKYSTIEDYINSGRDMEEFLDEYDESRKKMVFSSESSKSDSDDGNPPSDPDIDDYEDIQMLFRRMKLRPLEQQVKEELPEGWDISSLDLEENIHYILENQLLFTESTKEYVNRRYDLAITTYNHYLRYMSYTDPYSVYLGFLRGQLKILNRCPIVKSLIFSNMLKNETKDPDEVEENDFEGDFDVF